MTVRSIIRKSMERILLQNNYRLVAANVRDWPYEDKEFREIFLLQEPFGWKMQGSKVHRSYFVRNWIMSVGSKFGHWAECGTFKGSTALIMAEYAKRHNLLKQGYVIHLFDSFEGLSPPAPDDAGTDLSKGDFAASEADVRRNLAAYDCFEFHKGWIPTRFADVEEERFAFVHIDVDLYEPVRDCLEFFIPRMVAGGIIALDDYGGLTTPGARLATDEIAERHRLPVARLPFASAAIIVQ